MKKHGLGLNPSNLITSDLPVSDFSATRLFLIIADSHRVMLVFNDSLGFLTVGLQFLGFGIAQLLRVNCVLLHLKTSVWGRSRLGR